jgi:predicted ATPase/class 3 adenylate cyclase
VELSEGHEPTLMFTDIEGSVRLWDRARGQAGAALERHNDIVRSSVARCQGRECNFTGDGFLFSFGSPTDALRAAAAIHRDIAAADWPEAIGALRVRIAIHAGPLDFVGGSVVGPSVNLASRVRDAAFGGQTLVTGDAARIAEPPPEVRLFDMGPHLLRDVPRPVRLFLATSSEMPEPDFVPVRTLDTLPTNLTGEVNSFIGREEELLRMQRLLVAQGARLITITGPGGVGKSRLLTRVGVAHLDAYPDGVWLVELAGLTSPAEVPVAIGATIRMPPCPASPNWTETLAEFLAPKRLLLLLDNYEHLLDAAEVPYELVRRAPELACLITSRERLNVPGERVVEIRPLDVPDEHTPAGRLGHAESVRLFLDRASEARGDAEVTGPELRATAEVCRRLGGLPLGIELAAARLPEMTIGELNDSLEAGLDVLTTGRRAVPARQRSVRATIDWSCRTLPQSEAEVLPALSVFRGGFFPDAAQAVTLDEETPAILRRLREKSLLSSETLLERTRYSMLPLLREHIATSLGDRTEECRARAARHFAHVAAALSIAQGTTDIKIARAEFDNFVAALAWAEGSADKGLIVTIVVSMWPVFRHRGDEEECLRWQRAAVAACRDLGDEARLPGALVGLAVSLKLARRFDDAAAALREAIRVSASTRNTQVRHWALLERASLIHEAGDLPRAKRAFERCFRLLRRENNVRWMAESLRGIARISCDQGAYAEAVARLEAALLLEDPEERAWGRSTTLAELAEAREALGDYAGARSSIEESIRLGSQVGDEPALAGRLERLGGIARALGDTNAAALAFEGALLKARRHAPDTVERILAAQCGP